MLEPRELHFHGYPVDEANGLTKRFYLVLPVPSKRNSFAIKLFSRIELSGNLRLTRFTTMVRWRPAHVLTRIALIRPFYLSVRVVPSCYSIRY